MGPEMMAAQLAMQMGAQAQQQMVNQGLSVYDYINASKQLKAGKEAQKNLGPRVGITMPKSMIQQENIARQLYSSDMPGYRQQIDSAYQAMGSGMNSIKQAGGSIADQLSAVVGMNKNLTDTVSGIELANLENKQNNLTGLSNAIGNKAQYELLINQDKQNAYNQKKAAIDAMIAAGTKGKDQAIKGYFGQMNQNTAFNSQMMQSALGNPDMMAAFSSNPSGMGAPSVGGIDDYLQMNRVV